jgi:hypothetical protein
MARGPRYIPPGCLVETTTRTIHGRLLLRPGRDLNEIAYGVLARAAHRYDVKVCAFIFLSNHSHVLLVPADARQLALCWHRSESDPGQRLETDPPRAGLSVVESGALVVI